MLGQVLGALAQPLFTQTPTRVANVWFAVSERDLATVFCSLLTRYELNLPAKSS